MRILLRAKPGTVQMSYGGGYLELTVAQADELWRALGKASNEAKKNPNEFQVVAEVVLEEPF